LGPRRQQGDALLDSLNLPRIASYCKAAANGYPIAMGDLGRMYQKHAGRARRRPAGNEPDNPNGKAGLRCAGDAGNTFPALWPRQTSRLLLRIDYDQTGFERRGLQLSIRGDECELPGVGLKLLFQHQG
jgi:hypothetical protein